MAEKHRRRKGQAAASMPTDRGKQEKDMVPLLPTGRRVWLFRLAALVIGPALSLGLLEVGLRAIRYGYDPHLAVRCRVEGKPCLGENVKFGWRFFSPVLARDVEPFVIPAEKPAGTCRIFVLGESAAQGVPNSSFCFGRILEVMLRQRFPDLHFEVVTAAMSAINSHVVREIARDCARYQPDLFVVYLGNNEVIGPYGPGTVLTPVLSNLHLIRLSVGLRATKVGQLLSNLFGGRWLGKGEPEYWKGMEAFIGQEVRADNPRLQTVYDHLRRNIEDICRWTDRAGAQTILCTLGANLRDCPPFGSACRQDLTPEQRDAWDTAYRQGMQYELQSDYAGAAQSYLTAAAIDSSHAELQFRLGRCYWFTGQYDSARARYIRARDLDTLRFRADTQINEAIRTTARRMERRGVRLADTAAILDANSPHGLPGEEFFYEHVHLTFAGNYAVARVVLEQAECVVEAQFKGRIQRRGALPSTEECAERLAYNDWSRHRTLYVLRHSFLAKPPFTSQPFHREQIGRLEQQLQALQQRLTPEALESVSRQYRAAIERTPGDWRLRWDYGRLLAEDLKQYDAAIAQYEIMVRAMPHSYLSHDSLASVLRVKGDLNATIAEYRKVLVLKPTFGDAHYYLGWCYQQQGRTDAAMSQYRKAIRYTPTCVSAYLSLGELLFRQGRREEAAEVCRDGLAVTPDSALLHSNLGMVLVQVGRRDEGAREIRRALELDPNSPRIRRVAETLLGPGVL